MAQGCLSGIINVKCGGEFAAPSAWKSPFVRKDDLVKKYTTDPYLWDDQSSFDPFELYVRVIVCSKCGKSQTRDKYPATGKVCSSCKSDYFKRYHALHARKPRNPIPIKKPCTEAQRERLKILARNRRYKIRESREHFTVKEWVAICDQYGWRCLACGSTNVELTADHVIPVSKGGADTIDNIQPLCRSCNTKKMVRTIDYRPSEGNP